MPSPVIRYQGGAWEVRPGESTLDCLLRNGFAIPHSCKAGVCASCTMRAAGTTDFTPNAQAGLKETLKLQGYFHSCCHFPANDVEVMAAGDELEVAAKIASVDLLSKSVVRLRLHCDAPFEYQPGQYATLIREDGLARSYSLASLPDEGELEMHVRLLQDGRMSTWLRDTARPGDSVKLRGPSGACFYVPGQPGQPLVLAGTGTGLAPLFGILRHALQSGHEGAVRLFHGARDVSGLYLRRELEALVSEFTIFDYTACVLEGDSSDGVQVGEMDKIIVSRIPKLKECRGFVCGDPGFVQMLKKKLFLGGMSLALIHADSFLPAA